MATYFVDDSGSATSPYDTWAKAATSIQQLDAAVALASDDIVYFGADSNCTAATSDLNILGPSSGKPVILVSSTVGSGSEVAYSAGSGDQIITSSGNITFDGGFAIYGLRIKSAAAIIFIADNNESFFAVGSKFIIGPQSYFGTNVPNHQAATIIDCEFDLSADTSNTTDVPIRCRGRCEIRGGKVISNATYKRTGGLITHADIGEFCLSAFDISDIGSSCALFSGAVSYEIATVTNCQIPSAFAGYVDQSYTRPGRVMISGCGASYAPEQLYFRDYFGIIESSTAITRSGGASVSGVGTSWRVITESATAEGSPLTSPWMYGTTTAGAKTFSVHITNDGDDLSDADVWLEVEYLATSGFSLSALVSDQRSPITASATAQTDDTTSTWSGSGPAYTYKQVLSVSATIGQAGIYRARVCVGLASIDSSRNLYIDPLVVVS